MKIKIIPEKIWSKDIDIKGKPITKWFVKFEDKIFSSQFEKQMNPGIYLIRIENKLGVVNKKVLIK